MRILLKVTVSLLLLGVILWRLDGEAILRAVGGYHVRYVASAAFVFLVASAAGVWRWRLFVPEIAFIPLLRLSFIGQFYAMLLPGQIAGEAVKAYRLAKGKADMARLAGSVLVDRVIGTLALLLIGDLGYVLSPGGIPHALGLSLAVLTAMLACVLIVLRVPAAYRFAMRVPERLRHRGPRAARVASAMSSFVDVWRDFAMEPRTLLTSLSIGLLIHLLVVGIYMILAADLGIHVALADWLWIAAVVALAVLLPISFAGIGLREGALIGCLGYLGIKGEAAIALSFGVLFVAVLGALIGWFAELADRSSAGAGSGNGRLP